MILSLLSASKKTAALFNNEILKKGSFKMIHERIKKGKRYLVETEKVVHLHSQLKREARKVLYDNKKMRL